VASSMAAPAHPARASIRTRSKHRSRTRKLSRLTSPFKADGLPPPP